jgi:hypothetical protein
VTHDESGRPCAKHQPMADVNEQIGGAVTIGARVPSSLATDLARLAKSADRTVSAEVRRALRLHVDRERRS